jgi:hypothetical protein
VALPRDVVPGTGIGFERHGGHPGSARGRPSYRTQLPAQPADPCNKVLNGDYLVHARAPRLEALARAAADAALGAVRAADPGAEGWEAWWEALGREVPALGPLLEERARRYAGYGTDRDGHAGLHLGALLQAGFAEAEVLWRGRSSTIVAAFKA